METRLVPEIKFPVGIIVVTTLASSRLQNEEIQKALQRHQAGDWGDVEYRDWQANDSSLREGQRLWSVYYSAIGVRFWIVTEADRSKTIVSLPDDL